MADLVDQAGENDFNSEAVLLARAKKLESIARGSCLFCAEPVEALYCDSECRADYEEEQLIRSRQRRT